MTTLLITVYKNKLIILDNALPKTIRFEFFIKYYTDRNINLCEITVKITDIQEIY